MDSKKANSLFKGITLKDVVMAFQHMFAMLGATV